jgi:hypothetical protein
MQNESEHYMDYMCPKTFHNLSFAVNKQNNLDSNIICHDEAENVINISGKTVVKVSKKHEDFKKTKAIFVGVLLFFFMLMFNTPVWSQEWFVRPYGTNYGAKDGKSYESAWSGFDQVVWGQNGVKAGDTLWVCGLHDTPFHNKLTAGASGNSDSERITIRGDYPKDPGIIWIAALKYKGTSGWTSAGFGAFKRSQSGSSTRLVENQSLFSAVRANPPDNSWQAGNVYYDSLNKYIYYYPYSTLTDSTTIYVLSGYGAVLFEDIHYITLKNISVRGATSYLGAITIKSSSNIVLDGIDVKYSHTGVAVFSNSDNGILKNSTISECGNGIYLISSDNSNNSDYWLFENNIIEDINNKMFTSAPDQHGIGIQGGKGHLAKRNTFRNAATGVTLYCGDGQDGSIEITRNYASNIYILPSGSTGPTSGHGFAYDYHGTSTAGTIDVKIHHNIANTCENGGIRCVKATNVNIFNNTIHNVGIGIFVAGNPPMGFVKNNIITKATKYFAYIVGSGSPETFKINYIKNLYYPLIEGEKKFYYQSVNPYGAYPYETWKLMVPGNESGTIINNPGYIASEPSESIQFDLASNSPAIDKGEIIIGYGEDYAGRFYPVGIADIGAFEYLGNNIASYPPVSPGNLKVAVP